MKNAMLKSLMMIAVSVPVGLAFTGCSTTPTSNVDRAKAAKIERIADRTDSRHANR